MTTPFDEVAADAPGYNPRRDTFLGSLLPPNTIVPQPWKNPVPSPPPREPSPEVPQQQPPDRRHRRER
jgi:hypothetical protein